MTGTNTGPDGASGNAGGNVDTGNPGSTTVTPTTPASGSQAPVGDVQQTTKWYAGLQDAENLAYLEKKNMTGLDALTKSYRELETKLSSGGAATPAPKSAAEYKFDLPANIPQGMKLDDKLSEGFREFAFKNRMPADVAQSAFQWYAENAGAAFQKQADEAKTQFEGRAAKATEDLSKAWGNPDSPTFQRNREMARRAVQHADPELKAALTEIGVIVKDGNEEVVTNATLMKVLAKMGNNMFAEDNLFGAPAHQGNPFDEKEMSKPGAMKAQGDLIKNDPQKAALLIRAAGPKAATMYAGFLNRLK